MQAPLLLFVELMNLLAKFNAAHNRHPQICNYKREVLERLLTPQLRIFPHLLDLCHLHADAFLQYLVRLIAILSK